MLNEISELLKFSDDCSLSITFKTLIFLSLKCFLSDFFIFLPLISVLLLKSKLKITVLWCKLQAMDTFSFSLSGGICTQIFLLFLLGKETGLHFPNVCPYPPYPALPTSWVALTNSLSGQFGSGTLFFHQNSFSNDGKLIWVTFFLFLFIFFLNLVALTGLLLFL